MIAVTLENPNGLVFAAHDAFIAVDSATTSERYGTLAVAASDSERSATETTKYLRTSSNFRDIVFMAISAEWWEYSDPKTIDIYNYIPPSARHLMSADGFFTAFSSFEFAKELAAYASTDYTIDASDILYRIGSVTTRRNSYGPFYNGTCTEQQIRTNARDRTCQCSKGPRRFHVHSTKDQQSFAYSDRTRRYLFEMATCGVHYTPYIPPPSLALSAGAALSSGAIAGVAVGGVAFLLIVIVGGGAALYLRLVGQTRNNKNAPKDPTKPFAIVFTDFQSSTALWARATQAMTPRRLTPTTAPSAGSSRGIKGTK